MLHLLQRDDASLLQSQMKTHQESTNGLAEDQWPMSAFGTFQYSGYSPYSGYWPYYWPSGSIPSYFSTEYLQYPYYAMGYAYPQQYPYYATGYQYPQQYPYYAMGYEFPYYATGYAYPPPYYYGYQTYPYCGAYGASVAPVVEAPVAPVTPVAPVAPIVQPPIPAVETVAAAPPVVEETVVPVTEMVQPVTEVVQPVTQVVEPVTKIEETVIPVTEVVQVQPVTEVLQSAPVVETQVLQEPPVVLETVQAPARVTQTIQAPVAETQHMVAPMTQTIQAPAPVTPVAEASVAPAGSVVDASTLSVTPIAPMTPLAPLVAPVASVVASAVAPATPIIEPQAASVLPVNKSQVISATPVVESEIASVAPVVQPQKTSVTSVVKSQVDELPNVIQIPPQHYPQAVIPASAAEHPTVDSASLVSAVTHSEKTILSQDTCRAMFTASGTFRSMFGVDGKHRRGGQDEYCWGNKADLSQYMGSVNEGRTCGRDWEFPLTQPSSSQEDLEILLGFDAPVRFYNAEHPESTVMLALNGPRGIDKWNMCRQLEFMACGSQNKIPGQRPDLRILTSPRAVSVDDLPTHGGPGWGPGMSPNHVTAWQYCYLGLMCKNGEELFDVEEGGSFSCDFDGYDRANELFETMLS